MSGTRGGLGRIVAMGVALALALLLLAAREATAGKYSVAQCGWHLDADADWADTTGGAKFRPDAWCATPAGADPFDGAHMKSFTKGGATVSGTRFARWRWVAPPTTGITRVSGTWWHALHDGIEQRIGIGTWSGDFNPFAIAGATDVTPRAFVAGFSPAAGDRGPPSLRAGGEQMVQHRTGVVVGGAGLDDHDRGRHSAGRRHRRRPGLSRLAARQSARRLLGQRRRCRRPLRGNASRRRPCCAHRVPLCEGAGRGRMARHPDAAVPDRRLGLGDRGDDQLQRRAAQPGALRDRLRRQRGMRRFENDPDRQQPTGASAQPHAGRGRWLAPRRRLRFLLGKPRPGPRQPDLGRLLADNRAGRFRHRGQARAGPRRRRDCRPHRAAAGRLRLPSLVARRSGKRRAVLGDRGAACASTTSPRASHSSRSPIRPARICRDSVSADVTDEHSGLAEGEIGYRRLNAERWIELPTRKQAVAGRAGEAHLVADLPDNLGPGTYVFRAEAVDAAGNAASTTRRADGTEMALRKTPAPVAPSRPVEKAAPRAKTRLFAKLRWRHRRGSQVTIPFGAGADLSGRLLSADGAGLSGRRLRVVSRPSRGAVAPLGVETVETGRHGGFRLDLPAGPSRRITVSYPGESALAGARRAAPGVAGARRRYPQRGAACPPHRPVVATVGPSPHPRGTAAAPRQAGRDPVLRDRGASLAAGSGHAQRSQRPLSHPLPLPLRHRRSDDPPARRSPSPRSAGLTLPEPPAR